MNEREEITMKFALFGGGGHCNSVLSGVYENTEFYGVYDDALVSGLLYQGNFDDMIKDYKDKKFEKIVVTIGNVSVRAKIFEKIKSILGIGVLGNLVSVFSINANTTFEEVHGLFLGVNTYLGPNVNIGDNVIINTGTIIEHDCSIGSNCFIGPGVVISGFTTVGSNSYLGARCTLINGLNLRDNITIGAGAVVVGDILEEGTYLGIPAQKKEISK